MTAMINTMGSLKGKNIVVINIDQGVCLDIVVAAAKEGANVVCHINSLLEEADGDRYSCFLEDFEDAVAYTRSIVKIMLLPANLSTEEGVHEFFRVVFDHFSDFHALIYYQEAPQVTERGWLADTSLAEWNRDLTLYLRQPFLVFRETLAEFITAGGGRIVYMAPAAEATSGTSNVLTMQTALHAFHRSITKEYGSRDVACNSIFLHDHLIADPITAVPLTNQTNRGRIDTGRSQQQRESVVSLVLFLVSDAASYVNGEVFHLSDRFPMSLVPHIGGEHDPTL